MTKQCDQFRETYPNSHLNYNSINDFGVFFLTFLWLPAWISNYTHYNVWDEITYPFLNFNGATVEV